MKGRLIHTTTMGVQNFVAGAGLVSVTVTVNITDVYVADFHSDNMERCRPADVDLSHSQAGDFFKRAKRVDRRTLHDHYNHAPCYIEGTLKYNSKPCDWEIRPVQPGTFAAARYRNTLPAIAVKICSSRKQHRS